MDEPKGTVYIQKLQEVWYVWFPGDKKRRACFPQSYYDWKDNKSRLIKDGYQVVELGNLELPPKGSS